MSARDAALLEDVPGTGYVGVLCAGRGLEFLLFLFCEGPVSCSPKEMW